VARTRRAKDVAGPRFEVAEPELVVIVRPEAGLRATAAGLTTEAVDAKPLDDALGARASLAPLFGASEERLRYEASAGAAYAEAFVPDLSVYYRVEAPGRDLDKLASALAGIDVVEAAYVKPPAEPPQFLNEMAPAPEEAPPVTPDFAARQGYLDPAPGGIDARFAWTVPGGRGATVGIIDIEGAWRFSHEDLLLNQGGVVGGTQSTDLGWRNHGTAVVGEFGGDVNALGVTGICPDANVRAISIFGPGMGSAAAIRQAANALNPGDIILIELHRPGPRFGFQGRADQLGYIAIEWWPDDFAAVQFATGRGVIVVEAAGNGAENLDDALYNTPASGFPTGWTNPFNRANRDSAAIIVGAGAPPPGTHGRNHGPDRSRLDFSNFGSIVDAQGWGREVTTCAYGDLQGGANEDVWYTDQFSGTSSASPIVVGAVGALQGVARARGMPLTPATARAHLRATGSPQQDAPGRPATQRIGNRPDIRALVARITKPKELKREKFEKLEKEIRKELKREKFERKELKSEKLEKEIRKELKDQKREKIEKPEHKELKLEGKELKREKLEGKELKEGPKEIKERKPEIEKQFARERIEEIRRIPEAGPEAYGTSLEERVQALEAAVENLAHFISAELRPDLGEGALSEEYDLTGYEEGHSDY
jgi:Subtilase family